MPNICVRWAGKKLDLDVDLSSPPNVLKAQLYTLTDVPVERQKIIVKGKNLSDDSWNGITLEEGATIMMMGTTGPVPENMARSEAGSGGPGANGNAEERVILPAGLKNMGNTCYMNASLQCFRTIPELTAALKEYDTQGTANMGAGQRGKMITVNVKKLYELMDQKVKNENAPTPTPYMMLMALHSVFPQFASQDDHGMFHQQDANECFSQVLTMLADETTFNPRNSESSSAGEMRLRKLLEVQFEATIKCLENEEEPAETAKDTQLQLSCFLSQEIRYVHTGIKNKLTEEIEKLSPTLGRNARYERKALISRLPAYLSIQMVRFFYKETGNINAKILKDVKFPLVLDLFDCCTPDLQAKLKPSRDAYKEYDDFSLEELRKSKIQASKTDDASLRDVKAAEVKSKEFLPTSFSNDPGSNKSGYYELKAVITHKGRSSDSGHYVAWVRIGDSGKWAMCDDDEVHPVTEDDVLKLSGGGDWHCAYVLLYGPKKVPKIDASAATDE